MTDDTHDPPRRDASDVDGSTSPRWNVESPFCTDERGSFFAHGHRVSVGRVYRDTETHSYRAIHSVDEANRRALLYEVEHRGDADAPGDDVGDPDFAVVGDGRPLSVSWHDEGGRFIPV
jgi:hypothetical protein